MDVWMGMCTTFVFSALLEFTLVNYLWRRGPVEAPPSPPQCKSASGILLENNTQQHSADCCVDKSEENASCFNVSATEVNRIESLICTLLLYFGSLASSRRTQGIVC
jgi:hypothetical protein